MAKRVRDEDLRSARWFAADDLRAHNHRARAMQMGYAPEDWAGRPIIAIVNTWSDINPCHTHFRHRVEDVKRGVLQAGGFPIELPALSLAETFVNATIQMASIDTGNEENNTFMIDVNEKLGYRPIARGVLFQSPSTDER